MQANEQEPPTGVKLVSAKRKWYEHPFIKATLNGLIITLPIVIILFLINIFFNIILGLISPVSHLLYPGNDDPHWVVHIISLLILITIFHFVGVFHRHHKGQYIQYFEERFLKRIPLYTSVRDLVQQFAGLKEVPFSQVVLVDPFDSGVLMTGFITEQVTEDIYTVFVPTAPNPTNGNIYHVPVSRLQFIPIGPDGAMRTIVGMGTGSSALFGRKEIEKLNEGE